MGLWKRFVGWANRDSKNKSTPEVGKPPANRPSGEPRADLGTRSLDAQVPPPSASAVTGKRTNRYEANKGQSPIIIGFDFGTYSTKILTRQRGASQATILTIDDVVERYPWFASPSLVRASPDGAIFFGRRALESGGGTLYRSLKVLLLTPGSDESSPPGPTPDLLVAAYLCWAFGTVRSKLERSGRPPVRLNLAAPMSSLENKALKIRYLQIVQAAWESSFGNEPFVVDQGCKLADLERRLNPLMERKPQDPSERLFDVLPETVAPIVSLSLDPRMVPGMYMMVDIGAGTTEFSVNHVNEAGGDQKVLCYADESVILGCDHYEWIELNRDPVRSTADRQKLTYSLIKVLHRVWMNGYMTDAENLVGRQRWNELTVLLAGGGARRAEVYEAIQQAHVLYPWPRDETITHIKWHRPTGLTGRGQDERTPGDDLSLLAVAHGLSIERRQWPVVFRPSDIEPLPITVIPEPPPAYWYVGGK
jgi:hypothetical protein